MATAMRGFLRSWGPTALTTGILVTFVLTEYENRAPEAYKLNLPFVSRKRTPPAEFSGDFAPQQAVFTGNRAHSLVLVLQAASGIDKKLFTRAAARQVVKMEDLDLDVALGVGPKMWDALRSGVPLGNLSVDFKVRDKETDSRSRKVVNTGGDVFVHIKADTEALCVDAAKSILQAFEPRMLAWAEDIRGYNPEASFASASMHVPGVGPGPMCRCSSSSSSSPGVGTSSALCQIACVPHVGNSYVLFQRWDDVVPVSHAALPSPSPSSRQQQQQHQPHHPATLQQQHKQHVLGIGQNGELLGVVRQCARTGRLSVRNGSGNSEDKAGMLFVGYTADPRIFDYMLDRILGKRGVTEDAVLKGSTCSRSQTFIIPSKVQLKAIAGFTV